MAISGTCGASDLNQVRLTEMDSGTHVVLDVDRLGNYRYFTLHGPDRLVVDFEDSALANGYRPPAPNGAVTSVRTGQSDKTLRVVFDLGIPADAQAHVERDGTRSRLVFDLASTRAAIAQAPVASRPIPSTPIPSAPITPAPIEAAAIEKVPVAKVSLPTAAMPDKPLPTIAIAPPKPDLVVPSRMTATPTEPVAAAPIVSRPAPAKTVQDVINGAPRKLVVAIDAGHGGKDPGAHGPSGVHEKRVTLAIARELARLVNADPGMRAVLIRDDDTFVPLQERYMRARSAQADLFISIHADASPNRTATGASVYVLSTRGATSQAARWLADQENSADLVGGVSLDEKDPGLAAVLLDLSQSATMRASDDVAGQVLAALKSVGKAHKPAVERANFVVLRSPDVPSMLVETGFITNPGEEQRLDDPDYRSRLAAAIADGVRHYFTSQPPPGSWYALQDANRKPADARGVQSLMPAIIVGNPR